MLASMLELFGFQGQMYRTSQKHGGDRSMKPLSTLARRMLHTQCPDTNHMFSTATFTIVSYGSSPQKVLFVFFNL